MSMRLTLALSICGLLLAGCTTPTTTNTTTTPPPVVPVIEAMNFTTFDLPAIHQGQGLYEPTIDVSPSGVIYVSAHTTGVDAGGAPAYYSKDDGKTWLTLPIAATGSAPSSSQQGTPPPSDEIFIVAGNDGTAWGVDVTLFSYPVHGWCSDGADKCYYNPNGYNRVDAVQQNCGSANLNDRPWAAYANGTLLMVNNPGGGPVQVAAMKVPPAQSASITTPATGPTWNTCAGDGQSKAGSIPGIPGMRDDLFFAVPQVQGDSMVVVTGHAGNVMQVQQRTVLPFRNTPASAVMDSGQATFDHDGTLYVAAFNNNGNGTGAFQLAHSADDGGNFTVDRFEFPKPVGALYVDGNLKGPGTLVYWGLVDGSKADYYFGHAFVENGHIVLKDVNLATKGGPVPSRHVQGAALGPDGRAYMIMSDVSGNDDQAMVLAAGSMPLHVVVQRSGPRMPIAAALAPVQA